LETATPITPVTAFHVASISKHLRGQQRPSIHQRERTRVYRAAPNSRNPPMLLATGRNREYTPAAAVARAPRIPRMIIAGAAEKGI
jgi:hypothetical protein